MRVILASAFVATVLATAPARADSFVEVAGGVSLPLSDDNWTDAVESSPLLALRVGAFPNEIGGYVSADWMPTNTDAEGGTFPGGSTDISAHRFRLMVGPLFHHAISNTLAVTGRACVGADIAYASASGTVLGASYDESETDVGLGFEFGGGVWARLGGIELGGEVAIPIGLHDDDNDVIDFDYTSVDLQLLFGARFISR